MDADPLDHVRQAPDALCGPEEKIETFFRLYQAVRCVNNALGGEAGTDWNIHRASISTGKFYDRIFSGFSPREQQQFLQLLGKICANF